MRSPRTFPKHDDSESRDLRRYSTTRHGWPRELWARSGPARRGPSFALAALTEALRTDTDERRLKVITRSLGRFGPAAKRVVPDLTHALRKAVTARALPMNGCGSIADTLVRIAPGTTAADEAVAALDAVPCGPRKTRNGRLWPSRCLVRLGPAAYAAVPELITFMKEIRREPRDGSGSQWVPEAPGEDRSGHSSRLTRQSRRSREMLDASMTPISASAALQRSLAIRPGRTKCDSPLFRLSRKRSASSTWRLRCSERSLLKR